jgi:hypothetical protein
MTLSPSAGCEIWNVCRSRFKMMEVEGKWQEVDCVIDCTHRSQAVLMYTECNACGTMLADVDRHVVHVVPCWGYGQRCSCVLERQAGSCVNNKQVHK